MCILVLELCNLFLEESWVLMVDLYDGKLVMELEILYLVTPKSSKHGIRIGIVCIQIFCSNSFFFRCGKL